MYLLGFSKNSLKISVNELGTLKAFMCTSICCYDPGQNACPKYKQLNSDYKKLI